jgi:hypothetical protein
MALPGVVGVAEGRCDGRPCIKIFVARKSRELIQKVPSLIEGIPTSMEVTGEFKALRGKNR